MNQEHRICAVIPVYNHAQFIQGVYAKLRAHNLYCIIVNDGGDEASSALLNKLFDNDANVRLIHRKKNGGKGLAVFDGFLEAKKQGFSHALQVDADGQHNIDDYPTLLETSKSAPLDLITGVPIYDDSVPKSRYYSRYITHFWVWIETLSFAIKDSMCGFRIYPLNATLEQMQKKIAPRMDFDTHIMVRLYWAGINVVSVPTKVIYPKDGVSNFRLLRDNLRITGMHCRLVLGMLLRLPSLLIRKVSSP